MNKKDELIPRKYIEEMIENYRKENRTVLQMIADGNLSIEDFERKHESKYIYNVKCIDNYNDMLLFWDFPESKKWQRWKEENEYESNNSIRLRR